MASDAREADDIAGLLFWITEHSRMECDRAAEENDMTAAQVRALLSMGEPTPMSSLAEHMGCDASNVTGIADRLEARGLIRRETGSDRRIKLLALTPEGEKVRDRLRQRLSRTSPAGNLSVSERRTLKDLLSKMARPAL
jgi:DNA-binding MarR family transcriptional regulator